MSEAEMESTSDNSDHQDRMEKWFRDHPDACGHPEAGTKATRVEIPSKHLDSTYQIYLVFRPMEAENTAEDARKAILDSYPSHPGFTAESFRGTLALTRARGMRRSDEWVPAIYGYLIVNGTAASTPDAATMKSMSRPEKNSLDVSLILHCTSTDFSSCHFKMYARGLGLEDECVAQISIWMINIQDVQVGYQDAQDALDRFGPGP
ncbi:hypothetical protein Neosp_010707 [[Neocosmospora] mangrovei]